MLQHDINVWIDQSGLVAMVMFLLLIIFHLFWFIYYRNGYFVNVVGSDVVTV